MEDIEVKAGKTRSLGDRLILTIDEGSIAFLSGSVFNADGPKRAECKGGVIENSGRRND